MRMTKTKCFLSFVICIVLIAVTVLFASGCSKKNTPEAPTENQSQGEITGSVKELGNGKTQFDFIVADLDGNETRFRIHTDKTVVGDALKELGLIEGEEGQYGLYVKKVNGITADYDKDGSYWAFYVNGEMAMQGVDMTQITDGGVYSFKVSK